MKAILNKLWGKKTNLKTDLRAVKLSLMEDLKTEVEDIFDNMQDAGNEAMDGLNKAEQSLGYLQGNIDRAKQARQVKDDLIQQVTDLGIDVPQELENLDTFIEDILLTDDFTGQNDKLQEIKSYVDKVFFT